MPHINTENLTERLGDLSPSEIYWVYNGLDCCITHEIHPKIAENMSEQNHHIYRFERSLQAPILDMQLRGLLVDMPKRAKWIKDLNDKIDFVQRHLDRLAESVWGKGLNPNSPKQMKEFFYGVMDQTIIWKRGVHNRRIPSTDRDALEKIHSQSFYCKPFINHVTKIRELKKSLSVLVKGVDSDNTFRTSFNIGGTDTGRLSSSTNAFGTGSNVQNITDALREVFIARPGKKFAYIDLSTAESYGVGYLSGDEAYIAACHSGNLHTAVCRLIWPSMPWTGDIYKDTKLADNHETPFYRWFTHRDMAKRGGHATNYYGKPYTIAKKLKVDKGLIEDFQDDYFTAFPGIRAWQQNQIDKIQTTCKLVTPFGRVRHFFGRPWDEATWRSGIAYEPQSLVADYLDRGMLMAWRQRWEIGFDLLLQMHDAILIEYDDLGSAHEAELLRSVMKILEWELPVGDRTLVIPTEALIGWNWAYDTRKEGNDIILNPDGLTKWKGTDDRIRQQGGRRLDRGIRRVY